MPQQVLKITLILCFFSIPTTAYFWREPGVLLGLLSGAGIGIFSFAALTKLVVKWTSTQYRGGAVTGLLIMVKMLVTFGAVALVFGVWHVPPAAFLVGYGNLLVAVVLASGLRT